MQTNQVACQETRFLPHTVLRGSIQPSECLQSTLEMSVGAVLRLLKIGTVFKVFSP